MSSPKQLSLLDSAPALQKAIAPLKPYKLEPFQKRLKRSIYEGWKTHQRQLAIAGCGAGKTIISSDIALDCLSRGGRCLFLVDSSCLVEQTLKRMREGFGIDPTIYQAGYKFNPFSPMVIASMQTIDARLRNGRKTMSDLFDHPFNLVIVDEAHSCCWWAGYAAVERHTLASGGRILGLTATPWRTKPDEYLGQRFDATAIAPSNPEMVKLGRVVPNHSYNFGKEFDMSKLEKGDDGDYRSDQVESQAMSRAAIGSIVRNYKKRAHPRPTSAYCVTLAHAKALTEAFNDEGVIAEFQEGSTPSAERDRQDAKLESGAIQVLCSVGTRIAGWDLACISCVIFSYPTTSKARFFQAVGRGSRTYKGKTDYLILDFGGNINNPKIGDPMNIQDYDISEKVRPSDWVPELTAKTCPECELVVSQYAKTCPGCGFVFGVEDEAEEDDEIDEDLVEAFSEYQLELLKYLRDAKLQYFENGRDPEWAAQVFQSKYNRMNPWSWHKGLLLGKKPDQAGQEKYLNYLLSFNRGKGWVEQHLNLEYGKEWEFRPDLSWTKDAVFPGK